ncbi:MAG: tetratricopeptide repeat protein [Phycisphaerae bacterium]|nr:tetratricopeptide repeat protein [Phycisphaerae bacterium]
MSGGSDRFVAVRDLFDRVVELTPDQRVGALSDPGLDAGIRNEVMRLLGHAGDPAFLTDVPRLASHDSHDRLIGERIGAFRILRRIGSGGMGIVYEAEQDRPKRKVALKLIRPELLSEAALARFRREGELLGRLQHPGIAAIHAAGVAIHPHDPTQFVPFSAMELIEGEPITTWVRQRTPSLDETLELLASVADAVDHAHRRGVVHRDLKPANILVTADGDPKILDFGIARAIDGSPSTTLHTSHGDVIGTLGSMSPEQLRGESGIDERADVYALGSLAFEVLTGKPPFDVSGKGVAEAVRFLLEQEPPSAHRFRSDLAGDPSIIIATAMAKEPSRRYATAAALASDLRACRDRRPIVAREPGLAYRLRRYVQRNRILATATGVVVLVLSASAVWAGIAWQQERTANERTRRINSSLVRLLESLDPGRTGALEQNLIDTLDEAERFTAELDSDPDIALVMHNALAERYHRLGSTDKAIMHYEAAVEFTHAVYGSDSPQVASTLTNMGQALRRARRIDEAIAAHTQALDMRRRLTPDHPELIAECLNNLGAARFEDGDTMGAVNLFEEATRMARAAHGTKPLHLSTALNNLATAYVRMGRMDESLKLFDECIDLRERFGGDAIDLAEAARSMANAMVHLGQRPKAIEMLRRALEVCDRSLPTSHHLAMSTRQNLVITLTVDGQLEEAERLMRIEFEITARTGIINQPDGRPAMCQGLATAYRKRNDEARAKEFDELLATIR